MTNDEITYELLSLRAELLRLKRQSLSLENNVLRQKLKLNAAMKRDIKVKLVEIRKQVQPTLPF